MEDKLNDYRFISLGLIFAVTIYGTLVVLQERKKRKIRGKIIVTSLSNNDHKLIFTCFWFIFSLINLWLFFACFFR